MKVIKFFAMAAMAAAMMTSCSSDDELSQSNYPSDNIVRVTAGVNNAKTRAGGTSTFMGQNFSLTIVNKSEENTALDGKYTYVDEVFSKNTSDDWSCTEPLLWQNADTPVDIVAFAPAQEGIFSGVCADDGIFKPVDYNVVADQSTADAKNDLLYYYAPDFVPKDKLVDKKLSVLFNHAFCLIDINVTLGTEFNKPDIPKASPITKVILGGTTIDAKVDVSKIVVLENGTDLSDFVAANSTDATDIIATPGTFTEAANVEQSCKSTYSCIVIPQTVAANTFKVTLMVGNKIYEWTSNQDVVLKSGYRYTLNLTMGNDVVLLKNGDITATPWGQGTGGSLETE